MDLADQEPAIELWMDLVALAVVGSDLLDLQLAPLLTAAATPAVAGPAAVAEPAAAAVEPAAVAAVAAVAAAAAAAAAVAAVAAAAVVVVAGLAAAPVVVLVVGLVAVVSFGPVRVQLERPAAALVENAVDEEAKEDHVMQDLLAAWPQFVVGSFGSFGLAYRRSAFVVVLRCTVAAYGVGPAAGPAVGLGGLGGYLALSNSDQPKCEIISTLSVFTRRSGRKTLLAACHQQLTAREKQMAYPCPNLSARPRGKTNEKVSRPNLTYSCAFEDSERTSALAGLD